MMLAGPLLAAAISGLSGESLPAPTKAQVDHGRRAVAEHLEERARAVLEPYLAEHALELGTPIVRRGKGTWHFRFPQVVDGVEVLDAWIAVSMRPGRSGDFVITAADETLVEGLAPRLPEVIRSEAETIAEAEARAWKPTPPRTVGRAFRTKLVIEPRSGEPAWSTVVRGDDPPITLEVVVSAIDARVLDVRELTRRVTGEGAVFRPNPVVAMSDAQLLDGSDAAGAVPDEAYATVPLLGLDPAIGGRYRLQGENVIVGDFKAPADLAASETSTSAFSYERDDARFEQVMAYYHADSFIRYVRSLGFDEAFSQKVRADAHALTADQSYFDPTDFSLNFGDGGVDDAEDADIIVHELGHALQEDLVPGYGTGTESGALGEGFGDYLAASRREATLGLLTPCVGSWDATAYDLTHDPPCLRRVDGGKHYPRDVVREVHEDGEIWSSALWELRQRMGVTATDRLVIQSQHSLTPGATFRDAGLALLRADVDLGLGRRETVCEVLTDRGILTTIDCPPDLAVESVGIDDSNGGDGDGFLEPGESAELVVRLKSSAQVTMTNASMVLTARVGDVVVTQPRADYPPVLAGTTVEPVPPLPRVALAAGATCGATITLDAAVTASGFSGAGVATFRAAEVRELPVAIEAGRDLPLPIPDMDGRGVTSRITLPAAGVVESISVSVDIAHSYRGDLAVDLISPQGTRVTLHQRAGGSADDLVTTYPAISTPAGPGLLANLAGQPVGGTWQLVAKDWSENDTGTLRSWTLEIHAIDVTCNVSATCPGAEVARDSVRVTRLPGGAIGIAYPPARSACALGLQVRMARSLRPAAGAGTFPSDPAFTDVTAQDAVPGGLFTHVPPAGLAYYLIVEELPGSRLGPVGSFGH